MLIVASTFVRVLGQDLLVGRLGVVVLLLEEIGVADIQIDEIRIGELDQEGLVGVDGRRIVLLIEEVVGGREVLLHVVADDQALDLVHHDLHFLVFLELVHLQRFVDRNVTDLIEIDVPQPAAHPGPEPSPVLARLRVEPASPFRAEQLHADPLDGMALLVDNDAGDPSLAFPFLGGQEGRDRQGTKGYQHGFLHRQPPGILVTLILAYGGTKT